MSDAAELRESAESMIAKSRESGAALSIAEFARRSGINRTTLYSSFPDIVRMINEARPRGPQERKGRPRDEVLAALRAELLVARRERREARGERDIYALQIQVLSVQLSEALSEIQALTGVAVIHRAVPSNYT